MFTKRGLTLAEVMARRHRLLERWLTDILGLDWMDAHEEAHRLEHTRCPQVEDRLATMLGMPSTCPHGNPIPAWRPGRARTVPARPGPGRHDGHGRADHRGGRGRPELLEHLWRSGVRPDTRLTVQEVAPWAGTITTVTDGRTVVLGLAAAAKIWVYNPT
jgi:DtxR family Mn-dependent transcriptional regulator